VWFSCYTPTKKKIYREIRKIIKGKVSLDFSRIKYLVDRAEMNGTLQQNSVLAYMGDQFNNKKERSIGYPFKSLQNQHQKLGFSGTVIYVPDRLDHFYNLQDKLVLTALKKYHYIGVHSPNKRRIC